ncbi:MAG: hypothetical protein NC043_02385 [Muribaculaceae bacterium]|nr:hypothetical protein [Muribaculaceae bacterium]
MKKVIFLLAPWLLLASGCSNDDDPVQEEYSEPIVMTLSSDESRAMNGANDFGLEVFKELCAAHDKENIVLSPLSVSLCVSLAVNGASESVMDEILTAMGLEGNATSLDALNTLNAQLMDVLPKTDYRSKVVLANSVWLANGYTANSEYAELVGRIYEAPIINIDFGSDAGIKRINDWVSEKTAGLIPKFYDSPDPGIKGALLNATYFKGEWTVPFKEYNTKKMKFYSADYNLNRVDMMEETGAFAYFECADYSLVKKSFGNKAYSMVFICPDKSVNDALEALTPTAIDYAMKHLMPEVGYIRVPKFKITQRNDLGYALRSLGINDMFKSGALSRLATPVPYVRSVEQEVSFEINESGAEAAAVTGEPMDGALLDGKLAFVLDHPFLFMIREESTGAILFMGKIENL